LRFTPSFGEAGQAIRRMRGATQAHLVRLRDGSYCVVKFADNPVGSRVLVNELVSSLLLGELGIATPKPVILRVDEDFLRCNPEVVLTRDGAPHRPTPGWHFGSRFPGNPDTTAVFDLMPDAWLSRVVNNDDFLGALVFDLWTCNAGPRQAIFFRAKVDYSAETGDRWFAQMIDHDRALAGARWRFTQIPPQALAWQRIVHVLRPSLEDFAPWLARLRAMPDQAFDQILHYVPAEWVCGEERAFQQMIARLRARRNLVPALLAQALMSRPDEPRRSSSRQLSGRRNPVFEEDLYAPVLRKRSARRAHDHRKPRGTAQPK